MPTPVGHSLVGYALYLSLIRNKLKKSWKTILLVVFISNLPDIDYLPGLIVGYPNKYHHALTHSLGFAIIVGLIFALFYFWRYKGMNLSQLILIFSGLSFSHIVLDYFAIDTSLPYGVPLFWPITSRYFISPVPLFLDIHKATVSNLFISSLFNMHNFWAIIMESVIFMPIIGILMLKQRKALL